MKNETLRDCAHLHVCRVAVYFRQGIEEEQRFPYLRELEVESTGRYAQHEYLSSGEYNPNGMAGYANMAAWEEEFKEGRGVWWDIGTSAYSGRSVILDLDADIPQEAVDTICAMENYPLISDDKHSEMEHEDQCEQLDQFGLRELVRKVCEETDLEEDDFDEVDDSLLAKAFWETCSELGEYPSGSLESIQWPFRAGAYRGEEFRENFAARVAPLTLKEAS